jgi:hypothetical protein
LETLEGVLQGKAQLEGRYRWMLIEMLDQLVRHRPGGEMATYLQQPELPERAFIISRIGNLAKSPACGMPEAQSPRLALRQSLTLRGWHFANRKLSVLRRAALSLVLSRHESRALAVGLFRLQGEAHLWMYDRYLLSKLMREAGLAAVGQFTATNSGIIDWQYHYLDSNKDGSTYKPDSLYMEGRRPD